MVNVANTASTNVEVHGGIRSSRRRKPKRCAAQQA